MNSDTWFEIKFRDSSFKKYAIIICNLQQSSDGHQVRVRIFHDGNSVAGFTIEFTGSWISTIGAYSNFQEVLGTKEYSPLIANLVRDLIFGKILRNLNGMTISLHTASEYSKRVFSNENGILNFKRDPVIVAKENRFARELVLRELYSIQSGRGPSSLKYVRDECSYYGNTIDNAIAALKDRGLIKEGNAETIRLSHDGLAFVENILISPFSDKIFLIAACRDDIYQLIDEVYNPIVNEVGHKLIFQERSEPKDSIHDDIWEYIESCKLIICDLTHERANCFIEYGYALAKGKHIILCVEESEGKTEDGQMKVPFDTQNQRYSFWRREWLSEDKFKNNLVQFKNEIKERIEMKLGILNAHSEI